MQWERSWHSKEMLVCVCEVVMTSKGLFKVDVNTLSEEELTAFLLLSCSEVFLHASLCKACSAGFPFIIHHSQNDRGLQVKQEGEKYL